MEKKSWSVGLIVLALSVLSGVVRAAGNEIIPSKGELVLGEWNYNFYRNKAWADENHVPIFAVWSEEGCSYCANFRRDVLCTEKFKQWMAEKQIVMNFMESPDYASEQGTELHDCRDWCRNAKSGYRADLMAEYDKSGPTWKDFPFCRLRWVRPDGTVVNKSFIGMSNSFGQYGNVDWVINKFNEMLEGWEPGGGKSKYAGAVFLSGMGPNNSLQVLKDKTPLELEVPAVRTNGVDKAFENKYVVIGTDGKAATNVVSWAAGEASTNLVVSVPSSEAGKSVTLQFIDEDKDGNVTVVSETKINVIAEEPPNSSVNPLWIGERTAATLKTDEWTMDYVLATNLTAKQSGDAYTFVYFTGALWCPWCKGLEDDILESKEFKDLCSTKNVRLVTMDHPRRTMDPPSLLMYESTAAGVSGAGYLSRKGIPLTGNGGTNATDVIARNHNLAYAKVTEGGYARSRQDYAMFPSLCLLRKDGSLVGRIDSSTRDAADDGTGKKVFPLESNMSRIKELFDLADDDKWEELDNNWRSTKRTLGLHDKQDAILAAVDEGDVWRINGAGATLSVTVSTGDAAYPADCQVTVKIIHGDAKGETTIKETKGCLKSGDIKLVDCEVPDANCYVSVTTDLEKSLEDVTRFTYSVSTEATLIPLETYNTYTASEGETTVLVWFDKGVTNHLTGVMDSALPKGLTRVADSQIPLYVADATGSLRLEFAQAKGTLGYQVWNVGKVGFTVTEASLTETEIDYTFDVVRAGGISSNADFTVVLDTALSDLHPERYTWPEGGVSLHWGDGENGAKTVRGLHLIDDSSCDGAQRIVFKLVPQATNVAQTDAAARTFTLTVRENDEAIPGRLAIVGANPDYAKKMTVVAKSGSTVTLRVKREIGTAGEVSGLLTASAGKLSATELKWKSREAKEQTADLDLTGVAAGTVIAVVLTPSGGGVSVDSARSTLFVKTVAENAPYFADEGHLSSVMFSTVNDDPKAVTDDKPQSEAQEKIKREIAIEGLKDVTETTEVTLTHLSGTQPAGVDVVFEGGALVLRGTPTGKPGDYSFVYQVTQGETEGLTARIDVKVIDPTVGDEKAGYAPNKTAAQSRTFTDVMVLDADPNGATNLVGLLTLTIPSSGRLSARLRTSGGSFSFAADGWDSYGKLGALTATLRPVQPELADRWSISVFAYPEQTTRVRVRDSAEEYDYDAAIPYAPWGEDNLATDWLGLYNVDLQNLMPGFGAPATGDATLMLKATGKTAEHTGKMTYVGRLPNGRTISGSGVMYLSEETKSRAYAYLPIFNSQVMEQDEVSGVLLIRGKAAEEHKEQETRRSIYGCETGFTWNSAEFEPHGTFFDPAESLADCCCEAYQCTDPLDFLVVTDHLPLDSNWGEFVTNYAAGVKIRIGADNSLTATDTRKLTFSYSKSTGEFSGSFLCDFANRKGVRFNFRGVVLPGWGYYDCKSCALDAECQRRPFGNGACWCDDVLEYTDVVGRTRQAPVTYGCAVHIGMAKELKD